MRVSQDPQKAIDELVARTATASGLSTPLVLSHKDVCGGGGGESSESSSSSSGDNDSIVEVNTANALVKATSAGEISSDSSDVVVSKSSSDGVVPPASVSGPVPLPAPWLWATRAELEEVSLSNIFLSFYTMTYLSFSPMHIIYDFFVVRITYIVLM